MVCLPISEQREYERFGSRTAASNEHVTECRMSLPVHDFLFVRQQPSAMVVLATGIFYIMTVVNTYPFAFHSSTATLPFASPLYFCKSLFTYNFVGSQVHRTFAFPFTSLKFLRSTFQGFATTPIYQSHKPLKENPQ
ncbi:hypothetical protein BU24DRAFT_59346 [Aaosphaeria arxii CBS 175.79]|uniref:Uncharacterized protein n=1 Tax=Aaosphaeria arxii CBS 175.79 TaxID=1450172 RepID=A0A6A5XBX8_9PLEO|nr:uncharacterized protein BU24DRAFT_59346 [Aaosphaeria arxii CBS 175.79]KAF2010492.1 hypothetical protein BU24DRAFT_59346 [Aaosphaeria arxii CBS 175.79]